MFHELQHWCISLKLDYKLFFLYLYYIISALVLKLTASVPSTRYHIHAESLFCIPTEGHAEAQQAQDVH